MTIEQPAARDAARFLWGIVLLAMALRLGWGLSRPVNDAAIDELPDQREYLTLARNLLGGQGYVFVDPRFKTEVHAFRMPGYPLFVAACGANVRVIRAVQAMLGASVVLAVWWLGKLLMPGRRRTALAVAGLLVAVNPFLIYFSALILSETLFTAILIWGMVLLVAGRRGEGGRTRLLLWLAGGLILALGVLVRPSAGALPVVLGIAAAFVNPSGAEAYRGSSSASDAAETHWRLPVGATMLLLVGIVLLPWALRNRRAVGQWVWTDTNAGITLYDGFNPDATGASDQRFWRWMPELRLMGEVDRSRYLESLARRYVEEHPQRVAKLTLKKLGRTWSPVPLSEQFGRKSYVLLAALYSLPFDVLVLIGLWRGNLRRSAKVFLLIPAIYLSVVHMLSVGSLRYRLPAEPSMALIAASLVNAPVSRWKRAGKPELS